VTNFSGADELSLIPETTEIDQDNNKKEKNIKKLSFMLGLSEAIESANDETILKVHLLSNEKQRP